MNGNLTEFWVRNVAMAVLQTWCVFFASPDIYICMKASIIILTNIYKTISLVVCIDVLIPLVAYTDAARFWCATFMIDLI